MLPQSEEEEEGVKVASLLGKLSLSMDGWMVFINLKLGNNSVTAARYKNIQEID